VCSTGRAPASRLITGYALWLVPSGDSYSLLDSAIKTLASCTQPNTPVFEPHITLYSVPRGTDVSAVKNLLEGAMYGVKAESIKRGEEPWSLEVTLGPAEAGDHFYRGLISKVTGSPEVLRLREYCEEKWGKTTAEEHSEEVWKAKFAEERERTMFPHASLVYGETSQMTTEMKKTATELLGDRKTVTIGEITVMDTAGPVNRWEKIGEVPF
jgi:2'-5' RNA ligase